MTNPTTRTQGAPSPPERSERATAPTASRQRETPSKAPPASSQTHAPGDHPPQPRARGTPGSFDQPTPREDLMPARGNQHPHQTAEVPLGSGDVPELPGQGGQAAQNAKEAAPYLNVNGVRTPDDEPARGAGKASQHTEDGTHADSEGND